MRLWPYWRSALIIVQPETVVRWNRQGFRLYWRWRSRARKPGRPAISAEVVALIRRMCRENPIDYYHHARTHLSLDRNSPIPRDVEEGPEGDIIAIPMVGGLHHRYRRQAA